MTAGLRYAGFVLVLSLFLGTSTQASPTEPPPIMEEAVRPLGDPAVSLLVPLWLEIIHNFRSGQYSEMLVNLDKLKKAQPATGVSNLISISASLAYMSQNLMVNNPSESETALKLLDSAESLSRDLPDFYFHRSNSIWALDKGRVGELVGEYFQGMRHTMTYLPARHGFVLGTLSVLWGAGILVLLLFSLILLLKHVPLLGHDISHLIHLPMAGWQRTFLGVFLLFIPFLLDAGLVILFLVWWGALWLYSSRNERILIGVLLVFLASWPWMNGAVVSSLNFPGSNEELAYRCVQGECGASQRKGLEAALEKGAPSVAVAYALIHSKVRDLNDPDRATNPVYKEVAAQLERAPRAYRPLFLVALGNVEFVTGVRRKARSMSNPDAGLDQFQSAQRLYEEALALHPGMTEALYNKSKLLSVLEEEAGARNLLVEASDTNPVLVSDYEDQSHYAKDGNLKDFGINRELMMPAIPSRFMATLNPEDRNHFFVAHKLLMGGMGARMMWPLTGGLALLLLLLTVLRRFIKPSSRCIKCNAIHCARCLPEFAGTGLCQECTYYKLRSSYVDPKETWLREKRIDSSRDKRRRIEVVSTFLVPGAGHFLRGRPLRGLLFLGGLSVALLAIFLFPVVSALVSYSVASASQTSVLGASFWALMAFVVYFLALIDIYSWR